MTELLSKRKASPLSEPRCRKKVSTVNCIDLNMQTVVVVVKQKNLSLCSFVVLSAVYFEIL